MNCLCISQHEEQRYKVMKGRELHQIRASINQDYLRKKLGVKEKLIDVELSSEKLKLKGKIDEVLFLEDGTAAPFDYKYAEFKDTVFKTLRIQSVLYAHLIKENFNIEVNRGYICYIRSKNHIEEIKYNEEDYKKSLEIVEEIFDIISKGYYPKKTSFPNKCIDCCYKNICAK